MKILGVKTDNLTEAEILQKLKVILNRKNKKCLQVNTVNPEFILQAQKDEEFREILNSENSLNIADGIGLKFAGWWQGKNLKCRWPGADLMLEILKIANKNKQKVFLIGNKNGLSSWQETAEAILQIYPNLQIGGININIDNQKINENKVASYELRVTSYNIIFCALGSPVQEKLLNVSCKSACRRDKGSTFADAKVGSLQSLQKLQNKVKLTMGVGGSFDFLTGKIKRAPRFLQVIGLEWLWRLAQEPSYRWRRIFRAVIVFPAKIIFSKDR